VILAVETSCDDTCSAVVSHDGRILANVISSQGIHDRYGGVVPEIASRQHLELIGVAIDDALARAQTSLEEIDLVAVTHGPGLVAALLVGVATAKALAAAHELPLAPVDHLHGHVAASFLGPTPLSPPFLSLVASGGHTFLARVEDRGPGYEVLGQTLDDAAGEAFDKGARLLGLGYPGGAALERLAQGGDPQAFPFPTGSRMDGLDFSFAGLKTALLYRVRDLGPPEAERLAADLAASYQRAIVESLAIRTQRALVQTGLDRLAIGGGVAANGVLRARLGELDVELDVPPRELCTDNAAMIASAARYVEPLLYPDYLALDVYASGERPSPMARARPSGGQLDPEPMPRVHTG
jgi:N6-L-threonylcarbamoyladenine synthase